MRKFLTRKRNLSWTKIFVASAVGVLGGVYVWKPFFESLDDNHPKKTKVCHVSATSRMNKNLRNVQPGGNLRGNFNRIIAVVGLGWLTTLVIVRYVIKPWQVKSRMKENEEIMNSLYDNEMKQEHMNENYEI